MTLAVIVCAGCGLAGHPQSKCPDRKILRIQAFSDEDPIPFFVTTPAIERPVSERRSWRPLRELSAGSSS